MLDIGLEIRILRERMKISAKELAETVGLSQSQISRLEKGQRRIDTQVLDRIAQALGVDAAHFFEGGKVPAEGDIPAMIPESIGRLIRSERRRRHISAEELASRVGKPKAIIQSLEEGKRQPEAELLERILKALRLPAGVILETLQQTIRGLESQVTRLNAALAEATRGELVLSSDGDTGKPAVRRHGVPVLGAIVDGYPQEFDSAGRPTADVQDFVYAAELDHQDAFALHTVGDSMQAVGTPSFREGDLLVFAAVPLRSRDFAFLRLARAESTFRQVFFEAGGIVRIQPLNLNHASATYPRREITSMWRLVGHVSKY